MMGPRKRKATVWLGCLVVVSFAAGLWAAATPAIGPLIKPSVAVLMILSGLGLLAAIATSRPSNEHQRKARMRISVMGAAYIMCGVAQVAPSVEVSLTLMGLTLFLMAAAATGFPKRLFAPRS